MTNQNLRLGKYWELFWATLTLSTFLAISFQDDREVRVFEDAETAENEKIVEISTGPKGMHSSIRP